MGKSMSHSSHNIVVPYYIMVPYEVFKAFHLRPSRFSILSFGRETEIEIRMLHGPIKKVK